jgi:hypothetical protein
MIDWTHDTRSCKYSSHDEADPRDCPGFPTPKDRADYLNAVFQESSYGEAGAAAVADILTDLRHYCRVNGLNFKKYDREAAKCFLQECRKHRRRM